MISILRIFPSSSLLLRQEEVIELTKNLTQKLLAYWTDDLTAIEAVSLLLRHISYQSVKEMDESMNMSIVSLVKGILLHNIFSIETAISSQ